MLPVITPEGTEINIVIKDMPPGPVETLVITNEGLRVKTCGQWGLLYWFDLAALVAPEDLAASQRAALVAALSSRNGFVISNSRSKPIEDFAL